MHDVLLSSIIRGLCAIFLGSRFGFFGSNRFRSSLASSLLRGRLVPGFPGRRARILRCGLCRLAPGSLWIRLVRCSCSISSPSAPGACSVVSSPAVSAPSSVFSPPPNNYDAYESPPSAASSVFSAAPSSFASGFGSSISSISGSGSNIISVM